MKKIKLFLFLVSISFFINCSSDNDDYNTTPTTIQSSGTVNWANFNSSSTDITSLVTINGESAANYTVNAIKGDKVTFQYSAINKSTSKSVKREIVMVAITIDSPTATDNQFLDAITYISDPNFSGFDGVSGFEIGSNAPENYDGKFDIVCIILEDGSPLADEYIIDPKIRIRSRR